MTLEWAARIALALWILYTVAYYGEGLRSRGSVGLRVINSATEVWVIAVLIWAGWWS